MNQGITENPDARIPWMTTEEAAAYLGKSTAWLRNYAKQYGVPRVRLGQQWRYRATDLDRWLEAGLGAA